MISRHSKSYLLSALQSEAMALREVENLENTIKGQQQQLAIAKERHAEATRELEDLLETLAIQEQPQPEPDAQLPLSGGKAK